MRQTTSKKQKNFLPIKLTILAILCICCIKINNAPSSSRATNQADQYKSTSIDNNKPKTIKNKRTIKNFLKTALIPVGHTMYVYDGGWNKKNTGAGIEAVTIGESKQWNLFFKKQTSKYNYKNHKYEIHNGLDCSGYVGWTLYNTFNTKSKQKGYVMKASKMAKTLSKKGYGTYIKANKVKNYKAGDIMSSKEHVYIVLGQCRDKSIVTLESIKTGVRLTGSKLPNKNTSEAITLANKYMKNSYKEWYKKFPSAKSTINHHKNFNQMRWNISNKKIMSDPDNYTKKDAKYILKDLFGY